MPDTRGLPQVLLTKSSERTENDGTQGIDGRHHGLQLSPKIRNTPNRDK